MKEAYEKSLILIKENKIRTEKEYMKLAKEHNIKPQATKESKVKFVREDYGIPKTERAIRARKAKLKRKQKARS